MFNFPIEKLSEVLDPRYLFRFVWRILVVFTQNNGLAALRPIPTLNRKKLLREEHTFDRLATSSANQSNATFSLKSGRVIRNVKGAPDIQRRNWKLPKPLEINNDCTISKKLTGSSLLGEVKITGKYFKFCF